MKPYVRLARVEAFNSAHAPVLLKDPHTQLSLARRGSRTLEWTQRAGSRDLYELAIVVRAVWFADGSVWRAPQEELVDIF